MQKETALLLALLFPCCILSAQQKDATPQGQSSSLPSTRDQSSISRAVVVGISDYQHPALPDLRFADCDAEAFAAWLCSSRGLGSGSVGSHNLKLLVNSEATVGRFAAALDWLIDQSGEGDLAIIYFAGLADVETRTLRQEGFLLCHDAPPETYLAGGAFSLHFLQEFVNSICLGKKARVWVIADACHAGKLSGSAVGGPPLVTAQLAMQYANEVKILSCQPNEFSLEGEQWGGGRGVFSWYLLQGLYGSADADDDGRISLYEIGQYLEATVPPETAPLAQHPLVIGAKTTVLAVLKPAAKD